LQPEQGWNYEAGARLGGRRFRADAAVFFYRLQEAIVRQVDSSGMEYFVNSGSVRQPGFEMTLRYSPFKLAGKRTMHFSAGITLYDFRFENYASGGNDF